MAGYDTDKLDGLVVETLVPLRKQSAHVAHRDEYSRHPRKREMGAGIDLVLLRKDGSELPVDIALAPLTHRGNPWVVAVVRDDSKRRALTVAALESELEAIAEKVATAVALAESEERFRIAFEGNMAPMIFSDLDDLCIAVNDAFCEMVGFTREELLGHNSLQFTMPEDAGITEANRIRLAGGETDMARYVIRFVRKDGRIVVAEVSRSIARDAEGNILYLFSSERDITEERALADQLAHRSLHDPLTGLANRALFEDRLSQAYARITRQGGFDAVLMLDLDDFKGVNDTYGHLVGDQLLVGIARRFELVIRASDTLCRLGGDEFLYLAEGLSTADEAEQVAIRLLDVLVEPFAFSGIELVQHASVGVVIWDSDDGNYENCLQEADVALYEAETPQKGAVPRVRQEHARAGD